MSIKIAHLEVSVCTYEEQDNKVLMVIDAYNEHQQRIGTYSPSIGWGAIDYWKNLSKLSVSLELVLKKIMHEYPTFMNEIMHEFPTFTRLPGCGYKVHFYDTESKLEQARNILLQDGEASQNPTSKNDGRQTPPNMKYNVDILNPYFVRPHDSTRWTTNNSKY